MPYSPKISRRPPGPLSHKERLLEELDKREVRYVPGTSEWGQGNDIFLPSAEAAPYPHSILIEFNNDGSFKL